MRQNEHGQLGSDARIELQFLGGAALHRDGHPLSGTATRRHPLALLAMLATAPGHAMSRPKDIGLLWPDANESTGRNRLSSTTYTLRKALGPDALTATGDTLRLARELFECDLWRFLEAVEAGDHEAAVRAYGGDLLDGHYLADSSLFEERVAQQRSSLHRSWREAVRALAHAAEQTDRPGSAAHHWQTLAADDPLDTDVATRLLRSLAAAGRPGGRLAAGDLPVVLDVVLLDVNSWPSVSPAHPARPPSLRIRG